MTERKTDKYIVVDLKPPAMEAPWSPPPRIAGNGQGGRVLFLDEDVVPGAFYFESVWITPRPASAGGAVVQQHKHDYDEMIGFFGTNPDDIHDLGGEVELWLEDERHVLTRSCVVYVPKGMLHCPLAFLRVDRPIFHFTSGTGKRYL